MSSPGRRGQAFLPALCARDFLSAPEKEDIDCVSGAKKLVLVYGMWLRLVRAQRSGR